MAIDPLELILETAAPDMAAVNRLIGDALRSGVPAINELSGYIVGSGGKRLRPVTVVLTARACGYDGTRHHNLAAILEFIHTATLLHDDVVDQSELRRGRQTANSVWGDNLSVLVGDFLYSRSFELMVEVGEMRVMEVLAHASNVVAEGEVMQNQARHDARLSEQDYLRVITAKTAKLFEAAAVLGALVAGKSLEEQAVFAAFGRNFGIAYQMIDDLMDYRSDAATIGKNVGDDLAQGQPTLPLIRALDQTDPSEARVIEEALRAGSQSDLSKIVALIEQSDAFAYTARRANDYADAAREMLNDLPPSRYKEALLALTEFAVKRTY